MVCFICSMTLKFLIWYRDVEYTKSKILYFCHDE